MTDMNLDAEDEPDDGKDERWPAAAAQESTKSQSHEIGRTNGRVSHYCPGLLQLRRDGVRGRGERERGGEGEREGGREGGRDGVRGRGGEGGREGERERGRGREGGGERERGME